MYKENKNMTPESHSNYAYSNLIYLLTLLFDRCIFTNYSANYAHRLRQIEYMYLRINIVHVHHIS